LRVDVEVLSGLGVEVNIYSDDCAWRFGTPLQTQYWCFKGVRCDIPDPRHSNFGSWRVSSSDDDPLYLGQNLRIVIRGFDASFQIRQILNYDNCNSLTTENAPFCSSESTLNQHLYWGEDNAGSYLAKDRNAEEFYFNLTKAFSCGVSDHCQCREQTEECRRAIKIYACESIFNPCDTLTGFEIWPTYRTCRDVEYYCAWTFLCAGLPHLTCNHSFYLHGITQVTPDDKPVNKLDEPGSSGFNKGYIALIVLGALLVAVLLAAGLYILYQRSSAMGSVVFDDSRLGEYEAM